jgi:carbonic anhydrase
MKRLPLTLCLAIISSKSNAETQSFENAIKKDVYKIEMSDPNLAKKHEATTLLISCVDFRLRDETEKLMVKHLFLEDNYDEISIPGASLALVADQYPHWGKTLLDIIELLKNLHHIKRIIFLDHRNCGAYTLLKGKEHAETKEKETLSHREIFVLAKDKIKKEFPQMEIHTLLMGLDGTVENIR